MGFLKAFLNLNNAEGVREAMRMAYKTQRRQAERGKIPADFGPHITGLLRAMGQRLTVNSIPVTPVVLWHEVAPFILIGDEEVAVEALAEYCVYVERTVDTKVAGLRETLNLWLRRSLPDSEHMKLITNPIATNCRWWGLLERDVIELIEQLRAARDDIK